MSMRMCYSLDFGPAGKLKLEGGSLRAILRHNCRIPRPSGKAPLGGGIPGAEASLEAGIVPDVPEAEATWKENIDPLRIGRDQLWFNPAYGHGNGGWVSPHDLPDALKACPEQPVMDALHGLLGIEDVDGTLRYGEGKGDCGGRRPKPEASDASKRRRKARKAVRRDAVLAVDVILQASPSFFFPKIRKEGWTQEQIDKSLYWDRGKLDQGAVEAFREAGMAWARARWGEKRIAEAALHLDESCPHMHIVLIPEQNGRLNAKRIVDSPADARAMLDAMKPFFSGIHDGMSLERPTVGGRSTGATYMKLNRVLSQDIREAEARKAAIEQEVAQAEAEAEQRKQAIALELQQAEAGRAEAVRKRKLEEEEAQKARERREAAEHEAEDAEERRKATVQRMAEAETQAVEKLTKIAGAVQWAEGWKAQKEEEARKAEEEGARRQQEIRETVQKVFNEVAEKMQAIGKAVKEATARKDAAESEARDAENKAVEKVTNAAKAVQWAEGWKAKIEAEVRKAEEDVAEAKRACGDAVKAAEQRKAGAEAEARKAVEDAAEAKRACGEAVRAAEQRKAGAEAEARKAVEDAAEAKRACGDAVKAAEQRKAGAEAEAQKAELEAQLKLAWCKRIAEEGGTALERIRNLEKKYPRVRREKIIQKVVEAYTIEAEEERKRADTAEEFIQSMGEFGVFLRDLPHQIWKRFWNFLNERLPNFLPWVKELGETMRENWIEEQEKEEQTNIPKY